MKHAKLCPWLSIAVMLIVSMRHQAHAFGGSWSPAGPRDHTAEKILFVDNPDSTITAIVQIEYAEPALESVWLIPVRGEPSVGVSSRTVFDRLDGATAPQYWVEVARGETCAPLDAGAEMDVATEEPAAVSVLTRGSVGPYEYVTIAADAAAEWLKRNGYDPAALDAEHVRPYREDGLNLLAIKLRDGADVRAIRPIVLTYEGELPVIPRRLSAQRETRLLVWVVGASQAVPENYDSLVLNDARLDWLSARLFPGGTLPAGGVGPFGPAVKQPSNYDAVVQAAASEAGGRGFVTELAGPARQYRDKLWSEVDEDAWQTISTQSYASGVDAVIAASFAYAGWDGLREALQGSVELPDGVTLDEFARAPEEYRAQAKVDTAKLMRLLDELVVRPLMDAAVLLHNAPYLTRLHTTLRSGESPVDPRFNYNSELAQVSNVHVAKQVVECQDSAPWRMELPQGGVVAGEGSEGWPVAEDSLPANLKVVSLSTRGSGTVVKDNSEDIGRALRGAAPEDPSSTARLSPPKDGLVIGGTQDVRLRELPRPNRAPKAARSEGCSVSRAADGGSGYAVAWLALVGLWIVCRRRLLQRSAAVALACGLLWGCSSEERVPVPSVSGPALPSGALTLEQLRDPESCKGCHPIHYREWSSSMHAYAAKDPVFIAMNQRGQRETNGELGDFCVKCHAPMAVVDGLTKDGLNLDELPDKDRGVSCYFCHNVTSIEGDHNAKLEIANDRTMRGPIHDPLQPPAHHAEHSEIFEEESPKSSAMCGGCHDIVMPSGVHLERTFKEYLSGIFAKSSDGKPPAFASCVGCHMNGRKAVAAVSPAGAPERTVHEHLWPGIDVALIDFPNRAAMRSAVEDCQLAAASLSFFKLEVTPPDLFTFEFETSAGHNQPSGSAQDRRMWLEFLAYDADGKLLEKVSSGNIADDEIEERPKKDPKHDPNLLMFRDRIYDADGKPVHMFWEAERSEAYPEGYESQALPVASTTYIEGKHTVVKQYRATGPDGQLPARVTARLRMRPIGWDVLGDLIESGDLDEAIAKQMPTFSFGAQIEWTPEHGVLKPIAATLNTDCTSYRCMLDPGSEDCR